ncbi:unannotated protein [freshwater metagenome]|uniref:Unannotated protein n=1 Tax=freshwater metagenome TaxID=449393 RepID=A0A6J6V1F9_9ZZZZ|nr:hypothetical protein [Actinomycetota bacterium]MSX45543.1 hypothetical protein [Actinomycetota bacterium]MSX73737.1 hypothetical protein [Actinomycetota bacterium]MSZ01178.1 hypothetical protein [Actinomycetota bacterium]MTA60504.1 hypothetical protein [Actinomycetota bacterium]
MKKMIAGIAIGAMALVGGAFGAGAAVAAPAESTLVLSGGSGVFQLDPIVINATASAPGTVAFKLAGTVIVGCNEVATTTVAPFIAKCSWVPTAAGAAALSGVLTPADAANFASATSPTLNVKVGLPTQGVVSPIHIYVDTVLASGTSGALGPRFGVSCAITNEYIVGQGIVFRVYANNSDQGGAVMDSKNTAKAYIEIAGVKDPIALSYGNHSGIAFWTAVLKTGVAPLYNTLGVINYKVTIVAKDSSTMKVLSTKLVPRVVDGKRVKSDYGRQVYDRVSYYRTVTINPVLKGATGVFTPNWTAASMLTLFALPTV